MIQIKIQISMSDYGLPIFYLNNFNDGNWFHS